MIDNNFIIRFLIPDANVVVDNDCHNMCPSLIKICTPRLKRSKWSATKMIKNENKVNS